ncbi:MAG: hypothetical protein KGJ02_01375 [Verrucomicrobiota bacterium]|nr:hypothetical protein [Verrucomicrobiota bacterium]
MILAPASVYGGRKGEVVMLQKNHHFLFPETFFGSLPTFDDDLSASDPIEIDLNHPWVLVLDADKTDLLQQKTGLFIHWNDSFL